MSQIKYIFWDSDNTLIDTFALHWGKTVAVLKKHGIEIDEKYKKRIHENNGSQNWTWLSVELGLRVDQDQYLREVDEWYEGNSHLFKLLDGVGEAIEYFERAGCKQCVVSNGRRSSVMISHKAVGLEGKFAFVLCKEDYEGRKPSPAPYLAAVKKMEEVTGARILPDECLAIEDDPLGVEAAKKAGMTTIFRPTVLVAQTSEFADYVTFDAKDFIGLISSLAGKN